MPRVARDRSLAALRRDPRRVSRRTLGLFACTLGITLLAKGGAFQHAFGFDDWGIALRPTLANALLWQARIGGAWLTRLLEALDLQSVHSQFVWVALFLCVQAAFGTLVARHWHLDRKLWLGTAVAALVAIHPYTCDSLHMRSAVAVAAVSQALVSILLVPERWTRWRLVGGVLLFAFTLSIYQLMLHYLLMAALVGGAVAWGRYLRFAGVHGWSARARRVAAWRRILRHKSTALGAIAIAGTAVYAVAALIYLSLRPLALTSRTQLLELDGLPERAEQIQRTLLGMLVGPQALVTRTAQWVLLAILALAIVGLVGCLRKEAAWRSSAAVAAALVALSAGLVWSLGVALVLQEFWPAPRIVAPIAIFWAGALALASLLNGRWIRRVAMAGAALVLLSFVGIDNRIFSEQVRLNGRDIAMAGRIADRLEHTPGFSPTLPLEVHGARWFHPLRMQTASYDLNISAFGAAWSKAELLREVTGYDFAVRTAEQEKAAAAYCRTVDAFPGEDSVVVRDGLAIVCLEH